MRATIGGGVGSTPSWAGEAAEKAWV